MSVQPARTEAFLRDAEALGALPASARGASRTAAPLSVISDNDVLRWRYGERLEDLLEDACRRFADDVAVSLDGFDIRFSELDARANQMARFLRQRGIRPGDRIAVLLDRGLDCYVTLLGLLKTRAAYVPIDANHPADRLAYILEDSRAALVITQQRFADRFAAEFPAVVLDREGYEIATLSESTLTDEERARPTDTLCYVLYTSGTTGRPKGVAVAHSSICNFVRVAAEAYGYRASDRVYQGMSIAFDFSVEELWAPLVAGATLVPNVSSNSLFGEELADFLSTRSISCLCCVPTLLASIERDLPNLRLLLVGGEASPSALVKRWARSGRTMLNTYGPTEATVTATLGTLTPEKAVTIGRPLPTYAIIVLDPKLAEALPMGEIGEIGIAGVGVAEGYLNRPELSASKFIPDFLSLPNNLSGRIYRTGDLGRINNDGEIEYLGRIDTQVKLRGYRIELSEIESVLLEISSISQVAVTTFEPAPDAPELVAYYSVKHGAAAPSPSDVVAHLRARLPGYMTPAYLERLPFMPMLVSNKADRAKLPPPKSAPFRLAAVQAEPETALQLILCEALQFALSLETVSIDGDFFKEYSAHSLLMARFCARIRQVSPATHVAMRDIYANTTVRRLAAALDLAKPNVETLAPVAEERPSRIAYALTGAAQLLAYVLGGFLVVAAAQASVKYLGDVADAPWALLARVELVALAWFIGLNVLAIGGKWALIGHAKPQTIKLWGVSYYRFWLARGLISLSPAYLFVGEPLFNLFLRCLGARIGARALIATPIVPVFADLLGIGDDAVIAKRVLMPGYGVAGQTLRTDRIEIGKGAFVGEASVLDCGSSLGDFAQLGHVSSLQNGQHVPPGKRYHGSPAEETTTNFRLEDEPKTGYARRFAFAVLRLALTAFVAAPLAEAAAAFGFGALSGADAPAVHGLAAAAAHALGEALGLLVFTLFGGLTLLYAAPRLLNPLLREGRRYRLFGFHHLLQRSVETLTNAPFFHLLFGDSALIENFLRFCSVGLTRSHSTGSNFGTEQAFENPSFCSIGEGTVASDGLTMGNVTYSSHAFMIGRCRIGADNFLGTDVFVPPGARIGDNCMLATKTMAPIDGPLRENVGLLGSPCFEIPRAASRDLELVSRHSPAERAMGLRAKTRHNVSSALMLLGVTTLKLFLALFAASLVGFDDLFASAATAGTLFVAILGFDIFVERAAYGFRRMKPMTATSYEQAFWRVERYWKLSDTGANAGLFRGTPFRPMILRLLGAKVGACVFDDGISISERTLVEIGDGAALNQGAMLQSHSLEEGAFKSDFVRVGAGSTVGVGAFVHYGVVMGERTTLDPDAFLMKGEVTPSDTRWRGNPAQLVSRRANLSQAAE